MISKKETINRNAKYFKDQGIILPTVSELLDPYSINNNIKDKLKLIDNNSTNPLNLFRVHWYNSISNKKFVEYPENIVLPSEFTGVDAKIIVNIGRLFPMIQAHKVLAAYACLIPKLIYGDFDFSKNIAIWPSTGNYCRGGVAISKILGCRSIAVLPEGMSQERFKWLEKWITNSNDIIKSPGTESNVKEIYDTCKELEKDSNNIIINQFTEYNNYSIHRTVSGPSFEKSFLTIKGKTKLKPRLFVAASGSSGTLGAGDYLKKALGIKTAVVEALECPTLLKNGFGEHNIQGIGDKHVPLIHNVMNTDFVVAISDKSTDNLNLLFNTTIGKKFLTDKIGLSELFVKRLPDFGFSSIANILASIKLAKFMKLGKDDAIITLATDGSELYNSELEKMKTHFIGTYDSSACNKIFTKYIKKITTDNMLELTQNEKERIFNLGYYTWVEQQGISLKEFEIRKDQLFWDKMNNNMKIIDKDIELFNHLF